MDLIGTLRSTGAVREFSDEPVADEVVARVLDTARFAPSGGNAQSWHVVVVKDPAVRAPLRELYAPGWRDYLAMRAAGLRPWAPVNDRGAEQAALAEVPEAVVAAAVVALGRPVHRPTRLNRSPVNAFTTVDRVGGTPLPGPTKASQA